MRRLLASLLLFALVATGCSFDTPWARQHRQAETIRPASLASASTRAAAVATKTVRIYADEDYRRENLHWRENASLLVGRASALTEAWFGIRLQVLEIREWDARGGQDLAAVLAALEARDPGKTADWVVGLTGSLPVVTPSLHQLGMARLFSRHFVLRGMDDAAEGAAIDESLSLLSGEERFSLYRDRKRHKETVVFLHEWAHTLGAMHAGSLPRDVMNPQYGAAQNELSGGNRRLIELGLASREGGDSYRSALASLLENPAPEWDSADVETLRARARGEEKLAAAPLAPADVEIYEGARKLAREGKWDPAWRMLAPLSDRLVSHPDVQLLSCEVAIRVMHGAESICERAAALSPRDPMPWIAIGDALREKEDRAGALAALARARSVLEGQDDAALWKQLALAYHRLAVVSAAEACAARASDEPVVKALRRWALETRRVTGLPAEPSRFGIDPLAEAGYVTAVGGAYEASSGRRYGEAERLIREGLAVHPGAPGLLGARCELELRRNQLGPARKSCAAALAANEEQPRVHWLAAHLDQMRDDFAGMERHLRRALELDPQNRVVLDDLAKLLVARGRGGEVKVLRARFESAEAAR